MNLAVNASFDIRSFEAPVSALKCLLPTSKAASEMLSTPHPPAFLNFAKFQCN